MTYDEAVLKAIAYLQQQPVPRGPHVESALALLEDTQVTPTAGARVHNDTLESAAHLLEISSPAEPIPTWLRSLKKDRL